jgi:hypothetical protein
VVVAILRAPRLARRRRYAYDFGDDWEHVVVHEGMESAEESLTYPRCVSGARAFVRPRTAAASMATRGVLQAIANRRHPEHRSMPSGGGGYNPDAFDPKAVVF